MPECHNCPRRPDPGSSTPPRFENTPCASCQLPDSLSHHGRSHVSIEAASEYVESLQEGQDFSGALSHLAPMFDTPEEATDALTKAAVVLRELLKLSERQRSLVIARLTKPDTKLQDLASELGISTQAVHQCLSKAERTLPALRLVLPHWKSYGRTCPQRASSHAGKVPA